MVKARSETEQERPAVDPEVAKLIEEQQRSGKSVAAFARERGISPWRLYQAGRSRRRRRTEFVEVTVSPPEESETARLELVLPGDLRVLVPRGFDTCTLQRLLEVMRSC